MAEKMIVVCNGTAPSNIMPSLIFASSGIALDYDVHMSFVRPVHKCSSKANWKNSGRQRHAEPGGSVQHNSGSEG